MSRFPSHKTFKNKKTKPLLEIEKHISERCSPFYEYNILPRKTKEIYIYDILGQKFADFYLDNGKLFLGYTDKYITKMSKNYLKHTINSYFKGIFTYRLISLILKITNEKFKYITIERNDKEALSRVIKFLAPQEIISNSSYIKAIISTNRTQGSKSKIFIIEPHDEVFNLNYKILFYLLKVKAESLGKNIFHSKITKYFPSLNTTNKRTTPVIKIDNKIFKTNHLLRNIVVLSLSRIGTRFKHFSLLKHMKVDILILGISNGYSVILHNYEELKSFNISEFEAMLCYYHLLRESFLISKKEKELQKNVTKGLLKFYKLGIIKKISPYGALIEHPKFSNEFLVKEGIISKGNILYFSFSHNINDFLRLRRKLNSLLFGN